MALTRMKSTRANVPNPLTGRDVTTQDHGEGVDMSKMGMWKQYLKPVKLPKKSKKKKPKQEPEALETPTKDIQPE